MSFLIGIDFYGKEVFKSPTPPVRNINFLELKNSIVDEVHIKERTNESLTSDKEDWTISTRLLAKFMNDLEAGNVTNSGIEITQFAIKRRSVGETDNYNLGYLPFVNDSEVVYKDYLQTNKEYIYSIVPVGINGLEGKPNEASVKSDFVGWFVVDKEDTTNILSFDKYMDSGNPMVNLQLNQGRTEIKTMTKYPKIFYDPTSYHSFSLQAVFMPEENERSNETYQRMLSMVNKHVPLLVKGSDGSLFICDVSSPRRNVVQNSYEGFDYYTLTLDFTEVMDQKSYIENI